jgi:hypothetical protein
MDDGHQSQEAQAHQYRPWSYLHVVWRHAAQQHRSVRQNKSSHPDWSPLDDHLAFRCQTLWSTQHREGRGRVGDVRWDSYLHICGTPWVGNEYEPGQAAVWTMQYGKQL